MSRPPRYKSSKLVAFIKKYTIAWYVVTVLLYIVLIPVTIIVFPATTLTLSIFVLFAGFTAALSSLASAIVQAEQDKAIAAVDDEVSDEKVEPV